MRDEPGKMPSIEESIREIEEKRLKGDESIYDPSYQEKNPYIPGDVTDWGKYVGGYKMGADLIVKHVNEDIYGADLYCYPVMFMYRHYIEIALKEIIVDGSQYVGAPEIPAANHNLRSLWGKARELIQQICKPKKDELLAVETIIHQFADIDPQSFSFRYPSDTKGQPSLPTQRFDLDNVREIIDGVGVFLDGCWTYIDVGLSDIP